MKYFANTKRWPEHFKLFSTRFGNCYRDDTLDLGPHCDFFSPGFSLRSSPKGFWKVGGVFSNSPRRRIKIPPKNTLFHRQTKPVCGRAVTLSHRPTTTFLSWGKSLLFLENKVIFLFSFSSTADIFCSCGSVWWEGGGVFARQHHLTKTFACFVLPPDADFQEMKIEDASAKFLVVVKFVDVFFFSFNFIPDRSEPASGT